MALTRDGDLGTVNRCGPALLGYPVGLTVSMAGVEGPPCTSLLLSMARWNHGRDGVVWGLDGGGLDDPHKGLLGRTPM